MNTVLLLSIQLGAFSVTALLLVWLMTRPTSAVRRLAAVTQLFSGSEEGAVTAAAMIRETALTSLHTVMARISFSPNAKLRQRLAAAGLREQKHLDTYFAARLLGPLLVLMMWTLVWSVSFFWVTIALGLMYLIPDFWLTFVGRRRCNTISVGLPDALDLMVVCVDAGLGLDQALMRTGQELAVSHPHISEELQQINLEQRAGKARLEAWRGMADRTQLDVVKGFANMLAQTDRFGTPVSKALGTFADSLRKRRSQLAEERAARTTIKLMFPLVIFIFPAMFIVLLGPAALMISRNLSVLTK